MKLSEEIKNKITTNYQEWFAKQYAGKSLKERQQLAQFFTPADITIKMIEGYQFEEFGDKTILDPTCGSGNLLVACIIAGAKPENCYGNDYDPIMVDLCRERLAEFGVPKDNIHQGNALHSFCITKGNFNEQYDSIYFGRTNASVKSRFETMDDKRSDENAWNKIRKSKKELYEAHLAKEEAAKRKERDLETINKPKDEDKEELW